ncbi:hypothetical protein FC756_00825 [Lysinibacillus mangiferihumi]|uniref:Uncharacterized protein n=1 Tax=Lysinibacillus mangiferihumi TaxID=1130819 RepID=A0A4U2ZE12_9BACI|nr:hypothetical protein [Lysinibacillus mangiferihumi]TKI72639.1 hypothetical protein FC756_00825 [Lysinibacillus mangiferihumi]
MSCEKQQLDIDELRLLVDDTECEALMFTDEQYFKMYRSFPNIYRMAAHIWMLKATRIQKDMGGVKSYSDGDEKYEMTALNDLYSYYVNMRNQMLELAEQFENECEGGYDGGSFVLSFKAPKIL